ncbi:MAG: hypothetical protein ACKO3B_05070 [Bacteroidota bacterium]
MEVRNIITEGFRPDRNNWKAIMLCLGASVVFWLFSALNKEHTADLNYPVRIMYDGKKYIPVGALPEKVPLNVTGKGWNLLAASLGVRMDPVMLVPQAETGKTSITGDELLKVFSPVLGKLKINYFRTAAIEFTVDHRTSRKVALIADLSGLTMLPGYEPIAPVTIRPDSAVVDGPASLIAAVPDPFPVKPVEDRVSGEYRRSVLINSGKTFSTRPLKAEISFLAIKMQTVVRTIPVSIAVGAERWTIDRDSVSVTFRMRADQAAGFRTYQPKATVKPVSRAHFQQCKPELDSVPAGIKVVRMDSVTIKRK